MFRSHRLPTLDSRIVHAGRGALLLRLGPGATRRLLLDADTRLEVLRGRIWLTIDGEPDDHFPVRGASIELRAGSTALVGGDAPGAASVARLVPHAAVTRADRRALTAARALLSWVTGGRPCTGY